MVGLSKVLRAIEQQADSRAEQIVAAAEQRAEQQKNKTLAQAKEQTQAQYGRAELKAAFACEQAQKAAGKSEQNALLWATAERVEAVFAKALIQAKDDVRYLAFLQRMIIEKALPLEGTLRMNQEDLTRLPRGFMEQIEKELPKGAHLALEQAKEVESGFVLKYADIEQNCTLQAMLEEKRAFLFARVAQALGSGETGL